VQRAFLEAIDAGWQAGHPEIGPVVTVDARGAAGDVTARCIQAIVSHWPARFDGLRDIALGDIALGEGAVHAGALPAGGVGHG
jgi:hypothetical protein